MGEGVQIISTVGCGVGGGGSGGGLRPNRSLFVTEVITVTHCLQLLTD